MSLVLTSMFAMSQVLPFLDRSELRTLAVFEAGLSSSSEAASVPALRRTKTSATLCSVAEAHPGRDTFGDGAGDNRLISSRVIAVVKSACAANRAMPAKAPFAVIAAR